MNDTLTFDISTWHKPRNHIQVKSGSFGREDARYLVLDNMTVEKCRQLEENDGFFFFCFFAFAALSVGRSLRLYML